MDYAPQYLPYIRHTKIWNWSVRTDYSFIYDGLRKFFDSKYFGWPLDSSTKYEVPFVLAESWVNRQ